MRIRVDRGEAVVMRDGTRLEADVIRPDGRDPVPAIISRTPYGRDRNPLTDAVRAAEQGMATVIQDVRGRGGSDGTFEPFVAEGDDGEDTAAWVAAQPWCSGQLMLQGPSYLGATTW